MVERERFSNQVVTTLSVAMSDSVATLTPVSYTGFPATGQGRLRVGNPAVPASIEYVLVTDWATHPWPVTRGAEGTTAVSHTVGQEVATLLTAGALLGVVGVYEEGVLVGNVSDLDVVGAGATVTLVGTVGTLTVPGASGTVTSVGLTVPADLSVAGSPVTGAGTLAVTRAVQNPNKVLAGPTTGADAVPAYRALVAADVPAIPESGVTDLVADLAAKAPLASPTFTGIPTTPALAVSGLTGSVAASRYVGATTTGAPSTGAHLVGDFVVDQTGSFWVCTVAGTPGTWVQVAAGGGGGAVATDTLWDAKGDLAGGTGANAAARLPVGTNGQVLVADSAEATGLKWDAAPAGSGDVATDVLWDAAGDLAVGSGANAAARLPVGAEDDVLTVVAGVPAWAAPTGGGSGAITSVSAYASPPSSPTTGDLWFPSDGHAVYRWSGSVWVPWGPLFPLTEPISGDFAWVNQGAATVDTLGGGVTITAPAGAGDNLRIRVKAAPATPYTITALVLPGVLGTDYNNVGLCWRESGTGEVVTFVLVNNTAGAGGLSLGSTKFTSPTAWSAEYFAKKVPGMSPLWLRIGDNGTNRTCQWSADGQHWLTLHSVSRTDFLTADQVGFLANAGNATTPAYCTLISWAQA